jgi:ribosomal protein L27
MRPPRRQQLLHAGVDLIYQRGGKIAPGRPGLVGDHHHLYPGLIEAADGRHCLIQQLKAAQVIDVAHLFVDGAVPVQEHRGLTHDPSSSRERAAAATSWTLMAVRQG